MTNLEQTLTAINEKLHAIDKTLALNTAHLDEHIRRTELLEEALKTAQNSVKPLQRHVDQMRGAAKLLLVLSLIATIVAGFAAVAN